jgi:hypothetical protein
VPPRRELAETRWRHRRNLLSALPHCTLRSGKSPDVILALGETPLLFSTVAHHLNFRLKHISKYVGQPMARVQVLPGWTIGDVRRHPPSEPLCAVLIRGPFWSLFLQCQFGLTLLPELPLLTDSPCTTFLPSLRPIRPICRPPIVSTPW